MVLDTTKIKTIQQAKDALYGGAALSDADKAIFADAKFKKTDGTDDVVKLQATCKLLDEVKRAAKLTKKDDVLLNDLETAKTATGTDTPYQMINAVGTQVDTQITRLKTLPQDGDNAAEIARLQAELTAVDLLITKKKDEITRAETDLENYVKKNLFVETSEVARLEKVKAGVVKTVDDIKKDFAAKEILDKIVKLSKDYAEVDNWGDQLYKSGVSQFAEKFVDPVKIPKIILKMVKIIQEIDKESLKEAGVSTAALEIFDRIDKIKINKKVNGDYFEVSIGRDLTSADVWSKLIVQYSESGEQSKPENWPNTRLKLSDVFAFVAEVFPAVDYSGKTGNLVNKDKKHIKAKNNGSLLDKEYDMIWSAYKKNSHLLLSFVSNDFTKLEPASTPFKLKWSDGSFIKFFYEFFNNDLSIGSKVKWVVDKDGKEVEEEVTKFEADYFSFRNYCTAASINEVNYVERIKEFLNTSGVGGEKVDFEVDGWGSIARRVANSASDTERAFESEIIKVSRKDFINKFKEITSSSSVYIQPSSYVLDKDRVFEKTAQVKIWDEMVNNIEAKLVLAKLRVESEEDKIKEDGKKVKALKAELREKEAERIVKEQALNDAKGKDLKTLKAEFDAMYAGGPSDTKKYSWIELWQMEEKLESIRRKSPGEVLDSIYQGYKNVLETKVRNKLGKNVDLVGWMELKGSAKERMDLIGHKGEARTNFFEKIRDALLEEEKISSLSPVAQEQLDQIRDILSEQGPQDSNLTLATLKPVLKGTDAAATDDTYHLSVWQGTNNFKKAIDIKKLIDSVHNTDGTIKDAFATHLASHKTWGIDVIAKDANQWETFIKKEPQHIIGSIKLFQYENDTTFKSKMDTKIDAANSDAKADPSKPWNKSDKVELSQILSKIARGETGENLIKEKKQEDGGDHQQNGKTPWYAHWGYAPIWAPAILIVGLAALAYVYWEEIVNWWNGPTEERGEAETIGEEEEKD